MDTCSICNLPILYSKPQSWCHEFSKGVIIKKFHLNCMSEKSLPNFEEEDPVELPEEEEDLTDPLGGIE